MRHGMVTAEACSRFAENLTPADKPGLPEFGKAMLARAERAKVGELEEFSQLLNGSSRLA